MDNVFVLLVAGSFMTLVSVINAIVAICAVGIMRRHKRQQEDMNEVITMTAEATQLMIDQIKELTKQIKR